MKYDCSRFLPVVASAVEDISFEDELVGDELNLKISWRPGIERGVTSFTVDVEEKDSLTADTYTSIKFDGK